MKFKNEFEPGRTRRERRQSPHKTPYLGLDPYNGVAIQCQFCSGQDFRRSTLRAEDLAKSFSCAFPSAASAAASVRWSATP